MQKAAIFIGFAPWIIFGVVAGPSTLGWAALAALVSSVIITVPSFRRLRQVGVLDIASLGFFALLAILAVVLDRSALQVLEDRAQTISSVVLALVALGSVVIGRPFTEFYARQSTPKEYWGSALFRRINRTITLVWGLAFVVNALCDIAVAAGGNSDVFNWVIPAVVLVGAYKFTEWYPDHASAQFDRDQAAAASTATA